MFYCGLGKQRIVGEGGGATHVLVRGEAVGWGGSERRVSKTGRRGGRYLSLGDPRHQIPDMVTDKLLFQDPESGDA
jgi:hypothetical protein